MTKKKLYKVTMQGRPIVNSGLAVSQGKDVTALVLDLATKYCEVVATGSNIGHGHSYPIVAIGITKRSLTACGRYNKRAKHSMTEVAFVGYDGWHVFASDVGRYDLRVCLVKC